jgi:hypothetical protein
MPVGHPILSRARLTSFATPARPSLACDLRAGTRREGRPCSRETATLPRVPSGKKSKAARRAAQVQAPPPVRSKGSARGRGASLSGNRWWWAGGAGAVVAVIVVAIVLASGGSSAKPVQVDFAQLPVLQTGPPPWNNGSGALQGNLAGVHLQALAQEALAFHIHDHLDVYVNGKHVAVPAGIGISSFITELHTHAANGVVHVESPKKQPYTLGQFFGEWAVRLSASCLGRYCGHLHWWVNGKAQSGNPADLNLVDPPHQEIVVAAGKRPAHIPSTYKFARGE